MNNQKTITLDEAVKAARELPAAAQEALAKELLDSVADFQTPDRPAARQQIIRDRLAKPLSAAPRDQVMDLLRKMDEH